MGIASLLAARKKRGDNAADPQPAVTITRTRWRAYREGLLTNVVNPKVAVFFVAFLPQFIAPDQGTWTQAALLSVVFR